MTAARKACGGFCQLALMALARLCRWREARWTAAAEDAVARSSRWAGRADRFSHTAERVAR